jgi:hypothetical protein
VLDESGETIYDTLVMPDNPIVDYLTQYSGMTAERLEGVTTTLKDVQAELKKLVSYDNILVGHSLENDMKVLKVRVKCTSEKFLWKPERAMSPMLFLHCTNNLFLISISSHIHLSSTRASFTITREDHPTARL